MTTTSASDGEPLTPIWIVNCMESQYPGMWHRWFRNQCVAVGWPPGDGYHLDGEHATPPESTWTAAASAFARMQLGDRVVVTLGRRRVGRIGEVTGKAVRDEEWAPLVPPGPGLPGGEMGRRIRVRWDLLTGPSDFDLVVQLPSELRVFGRAAISRKYVPLRAVIREMNNPGNWLSLGARFRYESAIRDFVGTFPHRLEAGLFPHPNLKVVEFCFQDGQRADVMLMDRSETTVIVECKQHAPAVSDIGQLRGYMSQFAAETGEKPRGILVHAGAVKLPPDVEADALLDPIVEILSYSLDVTFLHSVALAR